MRREAGWELAVLQPEQHRGRGGQTRSLSRRASVVVAMWGLSLPATAVENPQAETDSRVFTLGPLGPVIWKAQQCWRSSLNGSVLKSVSFWNSSSGACIAHRFSEGLCSQCLVSQCHGKPAWSVALSHAVFVFVSYDEEILLQGCVTMWRVLLVWVLDGSLPATSKVSLLIREAAKASTEVVLDVQCVSAPFLPASRICLLPRLALPAKPLHECWAACTKRGFISYWKLAT